LQTNNERLIKKIKALLKSEKKDRWDEISVEEKAEINAGTKEIESGDFLTHEEVMANPRKYGVRDYLVKKSRIRICQNIETS